VPGRPRPQERQATNSRPDELPARLRALEEESGAALARTSGTGRVCDGDRRIRFPLDGLSRQRQHEGAPWRFLRESCLPVMPTAPLVHAGFAPFAPTDLFVSGYQRQCFPVSGIARSRHADHLGFDREDGPCLNANRAARVPDQACTRCAQGARRPFAPLRARRRPGLSGRPRAAAAAARRGGRATAARLTIGAQGADGFIAAIHGRSCSAR